MLSMIMVGALNATTEYLIGIDWPSTGFDVPRQYSDLSEALEEIISSKVQVVCIVETEKCIYTHELITTTRQNGWHCIFVVLCPAQAMDKVIEFQDEIGRSNILPSSVPLEALQDTFQRMASIYEEWKIASLSNQLFEMKKLLRDSFMEQHIFDREFIKRLVDTSRPDMPLESINQKFLLTFHEGIFQTVYISFLSTPGKPEKPFSELVEMIKAIFALLCWEVIPFAKPNRRVLCILNYSARKAGSIRAAYESLYEAVGEYVSHWEGIEFSIGISEEEQSITNLSHALYTCRIATQNHLIQGANRIYYYASIPSGPDLEQCGVTDADFSQLKTETELFNLNGVERAIKRIFQKIECSLSAELITDICERIVEIILTACWDSLGHENIPFPTQLRDICDNFSCERTLEDLLAAMMSWVRIQFSCCQNEVFTRSRFHVKKAKEYVAKHYMKHLNLNDVAKSIHLNSSYLSTIFKQETGKTFSNYLAAYRVNIAKRLIRNSESNISAVAKAVGYTDVRCFRRTFEKESGMPPSVYKRAHKTELD